MNESTSIKLDRSVLNLRENEYVEYKKEIFKISTVINFKEVVGISLKTKRPEKLYVKDLRPVSLEDNNNPSTKRDIDTYTDKEWKKIQEKYLAIQPLLSDNMSRKDIEKYSKEIGIHITTLYRWLKRYKSTGSLIGLLPKPSGRTKGETRLELEVERIIQDIIQNSYLTNQKISAQAVINKVHLECHRRELPIPGKNTIRNRIHKLSEYEVLKKRGERSKARTKYEPAPGKFSADYPMQVVQIDHTLVDLIVVDDETRQPIGRPWVTVAIDIYSRMIVGYYLSLNPPSSTSVALCIANLINPKDQVLLDFDINQEWNVWGFPETIHVDNGADFRAEALQHAGLIHEINIEFRPVKKTNYGGHIERLIGTLMKASHIIPGTTKSGIKERGEYDSDKHASMSFKEYEKYFLTYMTKIYHKSYHNGINMSPEALWNHGIFDGDSPVGLMPKPSDSLSILLDFLPFFKRTIQKNGVNIDGLNYYDYIIRNKIHEIDENTKKKKQFIFKRDPRDISYVWYYDEISREYFKIPLADQSIPSMTLWELQRIKDIVRKKGSKGINNIQILEAYEELQQQIRLSAKKTKKARKEEQRLKNNTTEKRNYYKEKTDKPEVSSVYSVDDNMWDDDIPDFG